MGACHVNTIFHRMYAFSVRVIGILPFSLSPIDVAKAGVGLLTAQTMDILWRSGTECAGDFRVLNMKASAEERRMAKRDSIRLQYQEAGPSYSTCQYGITCVTQQHTQCSFSLSAHEKHPITAPERRVA